MARTPWYRALTGCLQTIPEDEQNILVESGKAEVGELRAQPFLELARVLDLDQRVALATLAIAEIAVWPELDRDLATRLAAALLKPSTSLGAELHTRSRTAAESAEALAFNVIPALRSEAGMEASWEALRVLVHNVLRTHPDPVHATEQWLRRVVPMAVRISAEEARSLAVDALRRSIGVAEPWMFRASPYDAKEGVVVGIVARRQPTVWLTQVARFTAYRIADRKLQVSMEAVVPLDAYRRAFLFQSLYLEDAAGDAEFGSYDEAICVDVATGAPQSFLAL